MDGLLTSWLGSGMDAPVVVPLRRVVLNLLTLLAVIAASLALWSSWFQTTPQTQLDLFQTNLSLQAVRALDNPQVQPLAQALLGSDPVSEAANRYQQTASKLKAQLARWQTDGSERRVTQLQPDLDALYLRLGILNAYRQPQESQTLWQQIATPELQATASVLSGLWETPPQILPDAEVQIRAHLKGWFAATALEQLLRLEQRTDALNALQQEQTEVGVSALVRLGIVAGLPLIGAVLGLVILVGWIAWTLWKKTALLGSGWSVPWDGEALQAVITGWFLGFLVLGFLVPQLFVTGLRAQGQPLTFGQQAIELFLTYNSSALFGLGLIYSVARHHRPLPEDLLRIRLFDRWPLWGVAGYWVAIPVVVLASVLAQVLLPEGGGGNPILSLILESQGWLPRIIFLVVVSVCAPVFEEILFRGFLLTSLTRFLPVWGAIGLSALLFGIAHLNLADLLPLTVLGAILGVVYSHSRNLLAPMLLHSCWNAGNLLALLILGGGQS